MLFNKTPKSSLHPLKPLFILIPTLMLLVACPPASAGGTVHAAPQKGAAVTEQKKSASRTTTTGSKSPSAKKEREILNNLKRRQTQSGTSKTTTRTTRKTAQTAAPLTAEAAMQKALEALAAQQAAEALSAQQTAEAEAAQLTLKQIAQVAAEQPTPEVLATLQAAEALAAEQVAEAVAAQQAAELAAQQTAAAQLLAQQIAAAELAAAQAAAAELAAQQEAARQAAAAELAAQRILFVGDSRTIDLFYDSDQWISGEVHDGIIVYGGHGKGYSYLESTINKYGYDNFGTLITWMGANDTGNFENYKRLYNTVLASGKKLIVCTVGPCDDSVVSNPYYANSRVVNFNNALVTWAFEHGVQVIDLYTYVSDNITIDRADGVHYLPRPTSAVWLYILGNL